MEVVVYQLTLIGLCCDYKIMYYREINRPRA